MGLNLKGRITKYMSPQAHQPGGWVWSDETLPVLDFYCTCYLGMEFSSHGSWDKHIKSLIMCNRQKLGGLYKVLLNFALDLTTRRHILMAV